MSDARVPTCIDPQGSADRTAPKHEADRFRDFVRAEQSVQLGVGQNVVANKILAEFLYHGRIGVTRVNDVAAHAVEDGLFGKLTFPSRTPMLLSLTTRQINH